MSKSTFYVQFQPVMGYDYAKGGGKRVVKARAVRLTQGPPSSVDGQRAAVVKFAIELPDSIWEPFFAEAVVPESDVEVVVNSEPIEGDAEATA
jgi:hypothetical protein